MGNRNDVRSVHKHISIKKDPITGELIGVPKEWANELEVDEKNTIDTSMLPQEVSTQYELPESILQLSKSGSQYLDDVQLELDINAPLGLKGLSKHTYEQLLTSGVSKEEIIRDSQNFLSILEIYDGKQKHHVEYPTSSEFQNLIEQIQFNLDNPAIHYKFIRQIGKGATCKVYFIQKRENKQLFAARVMKYNNSNYFQLKREILIMQTMNSRNVVTYYENYLYQSCVFMIVEYMDAGCLTDLIFKIKIPESIISYILRQILHGLQSIHLLQRIHRDMKSDNILLSLNGDVKIADLGQAIQLTNEQTYRQTVVGTPAWMAPELIQSEEYTSKVDIWSLGIIGYELAEREPPLLRLHPIKAMHQIVAGDSPMISDKHSPEFREFIKCCLQKVSNFQYQRTPMTELVSKIC